MRKEKIALVTGANKGIGFEVTRELARMGFHVFLGARNIEAGETAIARITTGKVTLLEIDVADPESIKRAASEFSSKSDRLDALVNNAAICLDEDKNALTISPKILEETLRTNTTGPWLVAQAFAPFLENSDAPRIVNVSSGSGQLADGADGWAPVYSVSKTALNGVTAQLAAALPKCAVNSVCPGWVRTDMGGKLATRTVAEGAAGIVWLVAEAPSNLTGQFFRDRKVIPW